MSLSENQAAVSPPIIQVKQIVHRLNNPGDGVPVQEVSFFPLNGSSMHRNYVLFPLTSKKKNP